METPHRHLLLPQSALDDLLATAELEALAPAAVPTDTASFGLLWQFSGLALSSSTRRSLAHKVTAATGTHTHTYMTELFPMPQGKSSLLTKNSGSLEWYSI